jgi:hypothetical protein
MPSSGFVNSACKLIDAHTFAITTLLCAIDSVSPTVANCMTLSDSLSILMARYSCAATCTPTSLLHGPALDLNLACVTRANMKGITNTARRWQHNGILTGPNAFGVNCGVAISCLQIVTGKIETEARCLQILCFLHVHRAARSQAPKGVEVAFGPEL